MKLEKKYGAPVALVNCMELDAEDIWNILAMLLEEFPAKEADIVLPGWTSVLPPEHKLKKAIRESVTEAASCMVKLKDIRGAFGKAHGRHEKSGRNVRQLFRRSESDIIGN